MPRSGASEGKREEGNEIIWSDDMGLSLPTEHGRETASPLSERMERERDRVCHQKMMVPCGPTWNCSTCFMNPGFVFD